MTYNTTRTLEGLEYLDSMTKLTYYT